MRQPRRGNVPGATASRETTRGNDVLAHATNRIRFSWYLLYNIPAEDRRQASGGADPYRRHITPYSSPGRAPPQRPPTLGCLRGNTRSAMDKLFGALYRKADFFKIFFCKKVAI